MRRLCVMLAAAMVTTCLAQDESPSARNVPLTNPGFETGQMPAQWDYHMPPAGGNASRCLDPVRTGQASLRIEDPGPGIGIGVRSALLPAKPGVEYTSAAWVWTDNNAGSVYVEFFNKHKGRITEKHVNPKEKLNWHRLSVSQVAPPDTAYVSALAYTLNGASGTGCYDDWELREADVVIQMPNAGFEEPRGGVAGWQLLRGDAGCVTTTGAEAHSGDAALLLGASSTRLLVAAEPVAVDPGGTCRVRWWAKGTGRDVRVLAIFLGPGGEELWRNGVAARGEPQRWTQRTFSAEVPRGCITARVALQAEPGEAAVYVDDVALSSGPPTCIELGGGPQLLFDDHLIASNVGLTRTMHKARKYAGNPLLTADKEWEGRGVYLYGTVLREDGKFRMWYQSHGHAAGYLCCYAQSDDGLHWTRPSLGVCEFAGGRDNNLFATRTDPEGQWHNTTILPDYQTPRSERKYTALFWGTQAHGLCAAYSPDGIRWTVDPENPVEHNWTGRGDVLTALWDPARGDYLCFHKMFAKGRSVALCWSKDLKRWYSHGDGLIFTRDADEPPGTQFYGMSPMRVGDTYVGLLWVLHSARESDNMDVQLAYSHDMITWQRPPGGTAFIERGAQGAFDSGCIMGVASQPVIVDDEMWLYYGGWNGRHGADAGTRRAGIGLAKLRLNGFCSLDTADEAATLLTRVIRGKGTRLVINAQAAQGQVCAEVLDAAGQVIPGYALADCDVMAADKVAHTVTWAGKEVLPSQAAEGIQVRFVLSAARLYSFAIQ